MAKQESMNLIRFQQRFASEEDCHDYLFHMKWPENFICAKCAVKPLNGKCSFAFIEGIRAFQLALNFELLNFPY